MADITIPDLPVAIALDGTEELEIVQAGVSRRATSAEIANLAAGAGGWVVVTAAGQYAVPDSAINILINKTDGADVVLGAIADKVGAVQIVAAQGSAYPFNVTLTNGTIMGVLATYPFTGNYQAATFSPVSDLMTWVVS